MKHEILRKTLYYRILAFTIGLLIPIIMTGNISLGIISGIICETVSLITYYIYEVLWQKYVERKRLKAGIQIYTTHGGKYGWYNVVEQQEDGKILIEVV